MRADVASKLRRAIETDGVDHAVVVLNVNDDLEPLLKTFTVADSHNRRLQDVAHVSRLVVAAESAAIVHSVQAQPNPGLVERIELADEVVVHADADDDMTRQAIDIVSALNPSATVSTDGSASLKVPSPSHWFTLSDARSRAQEQVTADTEYAQQRRRFLVHRPMHPGRLLSFLRDLPPGLWRLTGAFWDASRPAEVGFIDSVGSRISVRHAGTWLAAVPDERHPPGAVMTLKQRGQWDTTYGDRCQDLILSGHLGAVTQAARALAECLLTDDELVTPDEWSTLAQPTLWDLETT